MALQLTLARSLRRLSRGSVMADDEEEAAMMGRFCCHEREALVFALSSCNNIKAT